MERHRAVITTSFLSLILFFGGMTGGSFALADGQTGGAKVNGVLVANGETVELPYVYVWPEKEGFFDSDDPAWSILFVGRPMEARELGDMVWDAAWIHIGVTESSEFGDQAKLQVYMQSIRFSSDSGGNVSGGEYPEIDIKGLGSKGLGSENISGRIWHKDTQTFFDDSYSYDLKFEAILSDPDAPIGQLLPPGGGEPGKAYLQWVETVHSQDIEALKRIVPPELAEQLASVSPEEAREEIGFMKSMTPSDVVIQSGSSDGDTAILKIVGTMDGDALELEITMTRMGEFWIPTATSM